MTTSPSLLEQFLREECTPAVRALICGAASAAGAGLASRQFEFNRFNLVLDFEAGVAVLDDELDTGPAGSMRMPMDVLIAALGCP